jgi:hypothetical protein
MHQKLTKHGKFYKQNNQLPTENHDELKDNSNILQIMGLENAQESIFKSSKYNFKMEYMHIVECNLV